MSNAESPTVAEIEELIEAAETLGRSDEPTIHLARAYLAEVSAHAETRERQAQELSNEVDCTAWKAVIKYAYADGGDGAQNIYNITSHYIKMRTERDALREQLAQAQETLQTVHNCDLRPGCELCRASAGETLRAIQNAQGKERE